jgi:hypothetical protein
MRQSAARAVGIQVIEADCARRCGAADTAGPARPAHPDSAATGPVAAHGLRGNARSKVVHAESCRDLARCTHCTARFSTIDEALRAGFRPHAQCVGGAPSGVTPAASPLDRQVGRRVRLVGRAAEAKAGSVVIPEGTREPVFVKGLDGWGALAGQQVVVTGVLRRVKRIPDPVQDRHGAISQGAFGEQYVVDGAHWQRR